MAANAAAALLTLLLLLVGESCVDAVVTLASVADDVESDLSEILNSGSDFFFVAAGAASALLDVFVDADAAAVTAVALSLPDERALLSAPVVVIVVVEPLPESTFNDVLLFERSASDFVFEESESESVFNGVFADDDSDEVLRFFVNKGEEDEVAVVVVVVAVADDAILDSSIFIFWLIKQINKKTIAR